MFDRPKVELWDSKTYIYWVVKHICFESGL